MRDASIDQVDGICIKELGQEGRVCFGTQNTLSNGALTCPSDMVLCQRPTAGESYFGAADCVDTASARKCSKKRQKQKCIK